MLRNVYTMHCVRVRNTRKHFTMRYVYLTSIGAGGFLGKHLFVHIRVRYTVYWTMYMYSTLCIKYSKKQVLQYIPGLYCTISVYGSSCNFLFVVLSSRFSLSFSWHPILPWEGQ